MRSLIFAKRNLKEMIRDPFLYIFCIGFPIVMIVLFQIILNYTNGSTNIFEPKNLIPGVMMFSYSFLMLMTSLLISKDKTQSFLKRLYTSPMKAHDYIIGYFIPYFIIGVLQSIVCIIMGYIVSIIRGVEFISFLSAILLFLTMIPIMIINIFIGMSLGILLNDKTAPGVTSVFISLSGIIGGAWMPLDAMGGFEVFSRIFPFHPSVYLGRIVTNSYHSYLDESGNLIPYSFKENGMLFIIIIAIYLIISLLITIILFNRRLKSDN